MGNEYEIFMKLSMGQRYLVNDVGEQFLWLWVPSDSLVRVAVICWCLCGSVCPVPLTPLHAPGPTPS